jgi:hypothetical protein
VWERESEREKERNSPRKKNNKIVY